MLAPKKQKFRKAHKGRVASKSKAGTMLSFGSFGLKSIDGLRVTARQIEAARRAAVRHMKRQGRFFIRIFPDLPVSKKPNEVRMGKGKGSPEYFAVRVSPEFLSFRHYSNSAGDFCQTPNLDKKLTFNNIEDPVLFQS